jgi:hypothetical protein
MKIIEFIKSLFAQRNEHVKLVKQIDKEIADALYKVEPQQVIEKPKKSKPKKKKPAKKKINEPK